MQMERTHLTPAYVIAMTVALLLVLLVSPHTALADESRVVTLGADLTSEQRTKVLDFFNLTEDDLNDMQVVTVTNQDEHQYLDGKVSSQVIGNKTLSCAYVQPTSSGGINVQTANLTYVSKDSIYNALQTAGIENCNVIVTAPFSVSGTGALTGIFMAYEQDGVTLDEDKKDAATQELVDTANLESKYGEEAPEVVSEVKKQVSDSDETLSDDQIRDIVKAVAKAKGINLSDEDIDTIIAIAQRVQGMDYDQSAFSTTLADAKAQVDAAAERSHTFFGQLQSFFESIGNFFAGLFNGGKTSSNILDNLNTNVFTLDDGNTQGSTTETETDVTEETNTNVSDTSDTNSVSNTSDSDASNQNEDDDWSVSQMLKHGAESAGIDVSNVGE